MKVKSIIAALLLMVAGLQSLWAQKVVVYKTNSQTIEYEVSDVDSIVFVEKEAKLVTEIVLSETSITLNTDETMTLIAYVYPNDAGNMVVTWKSSNTNIAIVDQTGKVTAIGAGSCTITCIATDGSGIKAECQVTVTKAGGTVHLTCPDNNHPHAIDLGLPSGTKWCCCNVGASTPEGYGGYYAWGETSTKSVYNEVTYKYFNGQDTDGDGWIDMNFSVVNIGSDIAGTSYDAATVNMGAPWRMPSTAQQQELIDNCSRQWTTQNGVNGILVTGKNGGQIFLPAAGNCYGTSLSNAGSGGYYWSCSLDMGDSADAYSLYFDSDYWDWSGRNYRFFGFSARAVRVLE